MNYFSQHNPRSDVEFCFLTCIYSVENAHYQMRFCMFGLAFNILHGESRKISFSLAATILEPGSSNETGSTFRADKKKYIFTHKDIRHCWKQAVSHSWPFLWCSCMEVLSAFQVTLSSSKALGTGLCFQDRKPAFQVEGPSFTTWHAFQGMFLIWYSGESVEGSLLCSGFLTSTMFENHSFSWWSKLEKAYNDTITLIFWRSLSNKRFLFNAHYTAASLTMHWENACRHLQPWERCS